MERNLRDTDRKLWEIKCRSEIYEKLALAILLEQKHAQIKQVILRGLKAAASLWLQDYASSPH